MAVKLGELTLITKWPPQRDSMKYDSNWILFVEDLRRVVRGIPSIFD